MPTKMSTTKYFILFFYLHAAVGHGHVVIGQGVAGHFAVVGAADRRKRAHVADVSSPVRPESHRNNIRLHKAKLIKRHDGISPCAHSFAQNKQQTPSGTSRVR